MTPEMYTSDQKIAEVEARLDGRVTVRMLAEAIVKYNDRASSIHINGQLAIQELRQNKDKLMKAYINDPELNFDLQTLIETIDQVRKEKNGRRK